MLGNGIYVLAEISRLTQLHPSRVRSWFKERPDGSGHGPIFQSDYPPVRGDYAFSFYDLIDVLVAGQFRDKHNVPMSIVRKAHHILQEELNTKHPFCHSNLYTDGKRIFNLAASKIGSTILSDVLSHQQFFLHIKEQLNHIDYNEITKLAAKWRISPGVVVDPSVNMGKPVIENTGTATHIITRQYEANSNNLELVADLYGISENDVLNAVKFEGWYTGKLVA